MMNIPIEDVYEQIRQIAEKMEKAVKDRYEEQ